MLRPMSATAPRMAMTFPSNYQRRNTGAREDPAEVQKRMRNIALYAGSVIVFMIGATYLAVPLYRLFCQATGYGGKTKHVDGQTIEDKMRRRQENPDAELERRARERLVRVTFDASVGQGLQWRFRPSQKEVIVRPGQSALAFFTAENTSSRDVIGVSSYNVQPDKAGKSRGQFTRPQAPLSC